MMRGLPLMLMLALAAVLPAVAQVRVHVTVERAVLADPARYAREPRAVVAALWTAQWLDQLAARGAVLDRPA